MPTLQKLTEKGEFTRGNMLEGREGYKIDTFGRIFGVTRQALINDDLGAFTDVAGDWGLAAAEFENAFLVGVLASNSGGGPKLADTKNLFHADHGNLAAAGAAISDTTLSAGRLALRGMKGLDGATPVNATAKYLMVPAAIETAAEKYLATLAPAVATNVNPFSGEVRIGGRPAARCQERDPLVSVLRSGNAGRDRVQLPLRLRGCPGGNPQRLRRGWRGSQSAARLRRGRRDSRGAYCNPGSVGRDA